MEKISNLGAMLYPGTLILFIILIIIWYGYKLKQKRSIGIYVFLTIGLALYLFSFYKNYGMQVFMIFWFIRDLIIIFIAFLLTKFTVRNKILVTLSILIAGGILGYWYYKNGRMPFTKPEVTATTYNTDAQLLIDLKDKTKSGEVAKLLSSYMPIMNHAFPQLVDTANTELDDYFTLNLKNFKDTAEIFYKLESSGLIDDFEFNEVYTISPVEKPNATFEQFLEPRDSTELALLDSIVETDEKPLNYNGTTLNDPRIGALWAFNYMEIDKLMAHLNASKPIKKAKIFILDTGVDASHEDIAANYSSLAKEYDSDTDRHGTHCAGIANAVSNNKLGIASLNLTGKYATVTGITVLPGGSGRQENIIDGIILAADNGADVISMSLGGPATDKRQRAYEKAIQYANDKGAIVIVAAGNENTNAKFAVPASCKGVITVSAIDDKLKRAVFSNQVSEIEYKVSAPGVQILSTVPGNDYQFLSGTSMATPYVSGLVAIMKAFNPKLSTQEVYKILTDTGKETADTQLTGKLIQPLAAIGAIDTKNNVSAINTFFAKLMMFKPKAEE